MKKSLKGFLYISPLVIGCVVFYLAPFCMMLCYSLSSGAGKAIKFVGLENYLAVAQNETFQLAFANTLKFLAVGLPMIMLLAGLVTIPNEQYESAELDGACAWQKFRLITTPQMWYSVFFALIFSVINAFKCFREIFLIGGRHPGDSLYMLQHFINNSFENLNYAKLSVSSVLLLIIILVFFGALYIFVDRKERYKL